MPDWSERDDASALEPLNLPPGIRSRFVENVNGLTMHIIEAGFDDPGRPLLLLLHGFPELAYSWRSIMVPLAEAGYHVVAPDQRGYGRTTGWNPDYDGDLDQFRMTNIVQDATALMSKLDYPAVDAVIGHDFGSFVAAWCALTQPDIFRAIALMSAPFGGPPARGGPGNAGTASTTDIHADLAALDPPRKHYQWYYGTRPANQDMLECPQGVHAFLRAYYHVKSADWPCNEPFPLAGWTAHELARMPRYYIMDLERTMAETVAPNMPGEAALAACDWLTEAELRVYSSEFERTGFQGGLQWYRCMTGEGQLRELQQFAGRTIDIPSCFVAGRRDWGIYQKPGALEAMQNEVCTRMISCSLVDDAGHWVQQEQPMAVTTLLTDFLATARR